MDPLPLGRCLSLPCQRWATLVCRHCQREVCAEHHEVHQKPLHLRAHRLNNQLNQLREQTFLVTDKIEQWTRELKNIDRTIGQPLTDLLRLPQTSISSEDLERLEKHYEDVQQTVNSIQRVIGMTPQSWTSDSLRRQLVIYSLRSCPGPLAGCFSKSIASHLLLVFQTRPTLSLLLFDGDRCVTRMEIDQFVNDLCWVEAREIFLLVTNDALYECHPVNQQLSRMTKTFAGKLVSLMCNDTDVYIVQSSEMILSQHNVNRPFDQRRQWSKKEILLDRIDRTISSIRLDHSSSFLVGMTIEQHDGQWRVDLFSLEAMQRLISGSVFGGSKEIDRGFCLLSVIDQQWLVHYTSNERCQMFFFDSSCQLLDEVDGDRVNTTTIGADRLACLDSTSLQIFSRESFFILSD